MRFVLSGVLFLSFLPAAFSQQKNPDAEIELVIELSDVNWVASTGLPFRSSSVEICQSLEGVWNEQRDTLYQQIAENLFNTLQETKKRGDGIGEIRQVLPTLLPKPEMIKGDRIAFVKFLEKGKLVASFTEWDGSSAKFICKNYHLHVAEVRDSRFLFYYDEKNRIWRFAKFDLDEDCNLCLFQPKNKVFEELYKSGNVVGDIVAKTVPGLVINEVDLVKLFENAPDIKLYFDNEPFISYSGLHDPIRILQAKPATKRQDKNKRQGQE